MDGFEIIDYGSAWEFDEGYISMSSPNDTPIERMHGYVNGREVAIIRYDHNDNDVIVQVGGTMGAMKQMTMEEVNEYIGRHVG